MSTCNQNCSSCAQDCQRRDTNEQPNKRSRIKRVIAIASGKGGVGKSLVTSLLAIGLNQKGYRTGILDSDITGPSIPKIFSITDKMRGSDQGWMPNLSMSGIQIISSNMMLCNDIDPVVWRGPIIAGLVKQFWKDVVWQDVDFLFVDMPPGTGDVPLTVFQTMHIDGIIIVTSPQELVSMIVSKAVRMANMMNIPIIGLIENMSYYQCGDCGKKIKIFGESHVDEVGKRFGVDVIGTIPLDPAITALCDQGKLETGEFPFMNPILQRLETIPVRTQQIAIIDSTNENIWTIFTTLKGNVIQTKSIHQDDISGFTLLTFFKQMQINTYITPEIESELLTLLNKENIAVAITESKDVNESVDAFLQHKLNIAIE